MAICNKDKFIVSRNTDNEFTLIVKQTGSTLPMEITDTDTFTPELYLLSDLSIVDINIQVTVQDKLSGSIKLTIPKEPISPHVVGSKDLLSARGEKVDKYYQKPTYGMRIYCDTLNNGKFTATVPEVYVV